MILYIVRHAIADLRDSRRWPDDSLRPLTEEGRSRFSKAAAGLNRIAGRAQLVLSSPYVRAWQTAQILSEVAGWPSPTESAALTPVGSPEDVEEEIRSRMPLASVAVVGHEPNLHELASYLLVGTPEGLSMTMKKGGVCRLDFPRDLGAGLADLRWHLPPKILRSYAESVSG